MPDRDDITLLHLPSITRGRCADYRDRQSDYLHGHLKKLLRPHERLNTAVYVMEEGIDNPSFVSTGDLDLHSLEKKNGTLHPPSQPPEVSHHSEEEFEEGPCGWGSCVPRCLQWCNNPKGYLLMYSLLAVMQGTLVNGLVNVVISTIEKRYSLNSSLTGLIAASYDIAFCLLSLFISFYGQRGHKPRWLAFSAFMIGLGALVFSLPHFASGSYEFGSKFNEECGYTGTNSTLVDCTNENKKSSLSNFLYVFILGQLLMGVGGTPLYTLGTAFFDDSLPTHKSSLYIGIAYGMSVVGPAVGYLIGGQLLDIYIDFNTGVRCKEEKVRQNVGLTPSDPRWLGAWWIGFLICGFITWLLIAPFSCFPKHLPGTAQIQSERISQAHNDGSENMVDEKNLGKGFKDFPISLWLMLKNPVLMALTFASCADAFITTAFAAFLPKFIENQFSLTSSFSAILGGGVLIPAAAIGQIVGGLIISKFKIECKNSILFSIIMSFVSVALMTVFIFAKCGNDPFAGVSILYNGTGEIGEISAPCNSNCSCARSFYDPVCGSDGVQYFSACYAGCSSITLDGSNKIYSNCSCIGDKVRTIENHAAMFNESQVIAGKCKTTCTSLILFMVFFFFVVVATFMIATPVTMAIIRCVPDKQRSFALGVQWSFIRLLGSIPGPISFGVLIDSSCMLWNINECGTKGACWTYNNPDTSIKLIGVSAAKNKNNESVSPKNNIKCILYVMDEGIDNPSFVSSGDLDLQSMEEKKNKTLHPPTPTPEVSHHSEEEFEEGPCGWGSCVPKCLQWCNNPKGYLFLYSLLAIMQGTVIFSGILVNGLVNIVISTIERRYGLSSSLTGLIAASYDITFCLFSLFVSFYGERGHKPRWLAFSAFMIGLGALIFSSPHFCIGAYEYGNKFNESCEILGTNSTHADCTNDNQSSLSNFLYVFILGQLLMGVGGTPLYTLGTAFFDDSLPTHKSSLYIGIAYGLSIVGPAIGFLIGGDLLNMYIDFNKGIRVSITPSDPRWLGAWWIGFLICGFVTWLLIAPFSCFPKHLPGTAQIQSERISQAHNDGSENIVDEKNLGKSFKDFPMALWLMMKNPVLISLTLASCADALIITGFAAFLPKYIENQFSLTSSFSAILGGGVLIPAAAIGQVVGGLIISKFKIECKNSILFSVITSFVSLALLTVFIFAKCGNDPFAGVSILYNG
ncbi:solute carrier organic anion transporter family member 4C1 [Pelobates cultripes]|nr:solute carrier organic anion transporter family member 4C1 [Pelobates cultripes]